MQSMLPKQQIIQNLSELKTQIDEIQNKKDKYWIQLQALQRIQNKAQQQQKYQADKLNTVYRLKDQIKFNNSKTQWPLTQRIPYQKLRNYNGNIQDQVQQLTNLYENALENQNQNQKVIYKARKGRCNKKFTEKSSYLGQKIQKAQESGVQRMYAQVKAKKFEFRQYMQNLQDSNKELQKELQEAKIVLNYIEQKNFMNIAKKDKYTIIKPNESEKVTLLSQLKQELSETQEQLQQLSAKKQHRKIIDKDLQDIIKQCHKDLNQLSVDLQPYRGRTNSLSKTERAEMIESLNLKADALLKLEKLSFAQRSKSEIRLPFIR